MSNEYEEGYNKGYAAAYCEGLRAGQMKEQPQKHDDMPTEAGWYWFDGEYWDVPGEWYPMDPPEVCGRWKPHRGLTFVDDGVSQDIDGDDYGSEDITGVWYGPLTPPWSETE